MERKTHTN